MATEDRYVTTLTSIVTLSAACALGWAGWVSLALISVMQDMTAISTTQVNTDKKIETLIRVLGEENSILVVQSSKEDRHGTRQARSVIQPDAG